MAALLVAMSVMAVLLTVVMPVWKQMAQREKEDELVFRGLQYAHAIGMFQKKYANAYPPSLDVLVTEKFLRKKYKDPITNDDFAPILVGQNNQGGVQMGSAGGSAQPGGPATRGGTAPGTTPGASGPGGRTGGPGAPTGPGGPGGGTAGGGIMGVTSKSKDKSIRIYNGRSHYNEWQFVYVQQTQAPGAGAPGAGAPGQRGRGQNPQNPTGPMTPGGPIGGQRGRGTGPGGRGFGPGGQPPQPGTSPFGRGR
jgi:type II secretory pathway pseudopilin PulG